MGSMHVSRNAMVTWPVILACLCASVRSGHAVPGDAPVAPEPITIPPPVEPAPACDDSPATVTPPATSKPWRPDGHCDRCGDCRGVKKVCVRTRTEKEITKICWGYRCETVCIPGPSIFCGTRRHHDQCGCWTCWLWKPTCQEIITRRVPEKKEVKRRVPAVEWSVEERCCHCRDQRPEAARPPTTESADE